MKIYLITGFLGSGKSTYLNYLLAQTDKKVGVLINEFGRISVDTITLNKNDIDLIELKNGSIFCACLKDKFIDGLIELMKMPLDEIYIESSGLSDPSNMGSIAKIIAKQAPGKEFEIAGVICLVDAVYFLKQLDVLESIRRQVASSHFIIINKADLVDAERIQDIKNIIKEINPKAHIQSASYGMTKMGVEEIPCFDVEDKKSTNTVASRPYAMMLDVGMEADIVQIEHFFAECAGYIYRAKGYIVLDGTMQKLDVVNDMFTVEKADENIDIKPDELNRIVLLCKKGSNTIKHISQAVAKVFDGSAKISS